MSSGFINIMKRAAIDAVENGKPCDVRYGTVTSVSPLRVQVTPQFIIPESLLTVPEHLTDYNVTVSFDWTTGNSGEHEHSYSGATLTASGGIGEGAFDSHSHSYSGTTATVDGHTHTMASNKDYKLTIHNALKIGDRVALLRLQGGHSYLIQDRIPK